MLKSCFRIGFIGALVLSFALSGNGQVTNPAWGEEFVQDTVTKIEVTLDSADLAWMLAQENLTSDDYQQAAFVYTDSDGNTHQYTGVGLRLRGNTSRFAQKKSFKIDMNEYGGSEDFYNLGKINLKGSHNDPSMIRERLAYYYMRQMGGAAARVNNVELYINGEYKGLYVNVEQIDKDFVKDRFGNKTGNLYKCLYGASLRTSDDVWNDNVFELKTNETINDRSDLIELIDVLNNTSASEFKTEIEKVLDIDQLLRYLAVEVMTGHWDGYSFNKNNYYLYHNSSTGKFEVIMYDCDNTFGIDWFGIDWALRNVYTWGFTGEQRPMFWRVLEVPEYRAQFTANLRFLVDGEFNSSIFPWIDQLIEQNKSAAMADTYRTLDYGFDSTAYVTSAKTAFGAHVKYGIEPYINQRFYSTKLQLDWPQGMVELDAEQTFSWFTETGKIIVQPSAYASGRFQINVFETDGRLVAQNSMNAADGAEIQLSQGLYLVELKGESGRQVIKVFVP